MPSLCRTSFFSCDNFSFVSAILVQLEVEQAEMSREATCQTGEHKEEFLIDARTNSFFFYTLRFTFNRVAGNKKAGPNYGDINRCNNWLKKSSKSYSPFLLTLGMTTNQYGVELARRLGKKVIFGLALPSWLLSYVKFNQASCNGMPCNNLL